MGLDNVIFTGRQDRSLVPNLLSISDACLVHLRKTPLFETVMPSKIFEACGMARPIVMGVGGFAAHFVEEAQAGIFIAPENEQELVSALETLASDPTLCARLGDSGLAYVSSRFDRDSLARTYLEIIDAARTI
jgi:glycosyltransferase involved in cell wall biosynthesis